MWGGVAWPEVRRVVYRLLHSKDESTATYGSQLAFWLQEGVELTPDDIKQRVWEENAAAAAEATLRELGL